MKINKNFIIRKIAGDTIVVPIGNMAKEYNGLIVINEVSEFILDMITQEKSEQEIVSEILKEFDNGTEEEISKDVHEFIQLLIKNKILEEY